MLPHSSHKAQIRVDALAGFGPLPDKVWKAPLGHDSVRFSLVTGDRCRSRGDSHALVGPRMYHVKKLKSELSWLLMYTLLADLPCGCRTPGLDRGQWKQQNLTTEFLVCLRRND